MDKIPLETNDGDLVIRFRDCFSVRYIQSAALLCRLGYQIEREYREVKDIPADIQLRHEAFILNSVLSTVAFLESTINELYADATDEAYFFADERHEALLRLISEKWKNEKNFDRAPMLAKYQKILDIAGKSSFDEGDQAFANVRELMEIRNYLMHYKREWVEVHKSGSTHHGEETAGERFEKVLRNKFATNPLALKNSLFFPDRCLGHGCAEWAIVNSIILTDEFFRRLDLPAPYVGIRDELATR
jgi:Ni/Co efflux regulator RcnB